MADGAIIRFGRVTNVIDKHGGGRIQVRTPFDNTIGKDEDLPYYDPLLPKMLHIIPKVGEMVLVFSMAPGDFNQMNFYVGPVISQLDTLYYQDSNAAIPDIGYLGWGKNPEDKKGVKPTLYPAIDDISIEGRKGNPPQHEGVRSLRSRCNRRVLCEARSRRNNARHPYCKCVDSREDSVDRIPDGRGTQGDL